MYRHLHPSGYMLDNPSESGNSRGDAFDWRPASTQSMDDFCLQPYSCDPRSTKYQSFDYRELEPLMLSCQSRKGLVADLSSLVLDIVTACNLTYEKGKRVHSLSVLKEITNTLICHTFWDLSMVTLLFSNVAVEASMAYAQIHTDDKADLLLWASEL
jgi:hypothetical protein